MGIIERKNREKEERKASILEKAKELILERGVDFLNMQEIADAAELSKATLYLYFPSKESILESILDEAFATFLQFVSERIRLGKSGLDALHGLWQGYLDFFGESQDILILSGISHFLYPGFPLLMDGDDLGNEKPARRLVELVTEVFRKGVADGSLEGSMDPEKTARITILIATAIIDHVARLPRRIRDKRMIGSEMRATFEILLRGLAAPGASTLSLDLP
jgi:AcrR family transcriptional regulator